MLSYTDRDSEVIGEQVRFPIATRRYKINRLLPAADDESGVSHRGVTVSIPVLPYPFSRSFNFNVAH